MAAATRPFVAAIDIGTTHSGYAFSAKVDFENDPLWINANVWNAGSRSLISHKAPTALLLNPDKTFHSFGYGAENNYSMLVEEEENFEEYYFFRHFKMILHRNPILRGSTLVKDETNKSLEAKEVFAHAIRFLRDHLYKTVTDKIPGIKQDDFKYVLPVPAIWDDAAKQFMIEAAKVAGIKEEQLAIALEPEAASFYCLHLPVKELGAGEKISLKATKHMVIDLGGDTANITVHQRQLDGTFKAFRHTSGGAQSGGAVDNEFRKFLEEIAGTNNMEKLKAESMEDYIDLFRDFEKKKRSISSDEPLKVSIAMPVTLIDLVKKDKNKKGFPEAVKQSKYADSVNWSKQKLQIANDTFCGLLGPTIKGILDHMKEILREKKFRDLHNILMVGGFSECELVQNAIRTTFFDKRIIVPDEAGLAVLKGSVLFGHAPRLKLAASMVARRTYGVQFWPEFDARKHPPEKKVFIDGEARCNYAFFKYIEKGQHITLGHQESQLFQVLKPDEEYLECAVYCSDKTDPTFIDEPGCSLLGVLVVPLDQRRVGAIEVEETLIFEETELLIQAIDMATGRVYEAYFDL